MTINLSKEQVVDLTKKEPALKSLGVGLGWDLATEGTDIDLDASAILFNAEKAHIDQVFFNEKTKPGVRSLGDNLTGEGEGDDETLIVDFDQVSPSVHYIAIVVTSYQGQKFNQLKNAFVRLYDKGGDQHEIAKYDLNSSAELGDQSGMIMAVLYRDGSDWAVKAIGQPSAGPGKTFTDLVGEAAAALPALVSA